MQLELESAFSQILGTNHVPSPEESGQIQDLLSRPLDELARLNSEIAHLLARLEDLKLRRDKIKHYVDAHQALLSPARRLPVDIIGEIFVHCLPTGRNATRALYEAPLLLGLICRSWRDVAMSIPRLWSSIHVYVPSSTTSGHQTISSLIEMRTRGVQDWLNRSGTLPLSISVVVVYDVPDDGRRAVENMARALVGFSSRWCSIELRVPLIFLRTIQSLAKEDVPRLQEIKVDMNIWPIDQNDNPMSMIGGLLQAPNLGRFSVVHLTEPARALRLHWPNLTDINIQNPSYRMSLQSVETLSVLAECTRLRTCTLTVALPSVWPPRSDSPAQADLHHLLDLRLRFIHEGVLDLQSVQAGNKAMEAFFGCMSTPALKHLTVHARHGVNDIWHHLPFLSLLSPCQLDSLDVTIPVSSEALVECLHQTPHLKSLIIRQQYRSPTPEYDLNDNHIRLFIPTEDSPIPLCPSLQSISLTLRDNATQITEETILELVQSRRDPKYPGISRLNKLGVLFNRFMTVDITPQISALKATGMVFDLQYSTAYDKPEAGQPPMESSLYGRSWYEL